MLRRVKLCDLDPDRAYFHFTKTIDLSRIEKNNLTSEISASLAMADNTKRIHFSTGVSSILKYHDVYLKWMMNTMYGEKSLRKKYDDDVFNTKMYEWSKEFLTDNYKSYQYKKNAVFTKYYHDMLECMYLVINVSNACDYNKDEYDEIKVKYNLDKNSTDYLIMKKIYGDYSDFDSKVMELWNMSTFRRRYVMTKDIRVVILDTLDVNVIDILKYVYENYKNIKYDLLDDFMLWLKLNEGK